MAKKWWKKVEDVTESVGFNTYGSLEGNDWGFQIDSPEGQDCNIELNADTLDELKSKLRNWVDNYDVSEETYIWLDHSGHGTNGAPYDMRDAYNDMEWFLNKATELSDAINDI